MNIYKIYVKEYLGYDTYDSAIVIAENEEAARRIHPGDRPYDRKKGYNFETGLFDKLWYESDSYIYDWTMPENVSVELVGTTDLFPAGTVLCASYNAG